MAAPTADLPLQTLLTGGIAEPASQKLAGKRKAQAEDEIAEEGAEGHTASHDSTPGGSQGAPAASQSAKRKVYSQHKVRTSLQERTLDSMFPIAHPSQRTGSGDGDGVVGTPGTPPVLRGKEIKESLCYLKSVKDLRSIILKQNHHRTRPLLPIRLIFAAYTSPPPQSSARSSRSTLSSA